MYVKCFLTVLFYASYCLAVPTGEVAKSLDHGRFPRILHDYLRLNHLLVQINAEGKTFLFHKENTASYFDALEICKTYGMDLLRIENAEKNQLVNRLMEKYTRSGEGPFWMSGNRLEDKETWKWANGERIAYFNWAVSEPNNAKMDEMCIELYIDNVAWNDERCTIRNSFICENKPDAIQVKEDENKLTVDTKEGSHTPFNMIDSNFQKGDKRTKEVFGKTSIQKE